MQQGISRIARDRILHPYTFPVTPPRQCLLMSAIWSGLKEAGGKTGWLGAQIKHPPRSSDPRPRPSLTTWHERQFKSFNGKDSTVRPKTDREGSRAMRARTHDIWVSEHLYYILREQLTIKKEWKNTARGHRRAGRQRGACTTRRKRGTQVSRTQIRAQAAPSAMCTVICACMSKLWSG